MVARFDLNWKILQKRKYKFYYSLTNTSNVITKFLQFLQLLLLKNNCVIGRFQEKLTYSGF